MHTTCVEAETGNGSALHQVRGPDFNMTHGTARRQEQSLLFINLSAALHPQSTGRHCVLRI